MNPSQHKFPIGEVLPHSGPMLLLDEVLESGAEHVSCGLSIRRDTLFCDGQKGVPAWVGVEYMAQTAGVYSGIVDRLGGRSPAICLLLGSRKYTAQTPYFAIGTELRVVATLILRDDSDLAVFDCKIFGRSNGEAERILATGDIKAYRPSDLAAIVRGERVQ